MRKRDIIKEAKIEKEIVKKYIEMTFEDINDSTKYLGKVKVSDIETDDYMLTLYRKGVIYRKLRRVGIVDGSEQRTIKYKQII